MRAVAGRLRRRRLRRRRAPHEGPRRRHVVRGGHHRRATSRRPSRPVVTGPSRLSPTSTRFDIAIITVPTPLLDGVPDLTFIDEAGCQLAPLLTEGATVVLESTTYPGTTEERLCPVLERGLRPEGRAGLPPRLQPRAHRSRQQDVDARQHAEGRERHRRGEPGQGQGVLRRHRRHHRAGEEPEGSGADQAPGEHLPAREHRARERAGHVRVRPRHRRVGRHRRRLHQALRLPPLHPRTRRGWPLPPRRSQLPAAGR